MKQQNYQSNQISNVIYDSLQQEKTEYDTQCDQEKKSIHCVFCKRMPIKPIQLVCNHQMCFTCANFLKEQESDSGIQIRYRISCPGCSATTVTYNLKNILMIQKNEINDQRELDSIRTGTLNTQESCSKYNYIKQNIYEKNNNNNYIIDNNNGYGQQFQSNKSSGNLQQQQGQRNNSSGGNNNNNNSNNNIKIENNIIVNPNISSYSSINNINNSALNNYTVKSQIKNNSLFFSSQSNQQNQQQNIENAIYIKNDTNQNTQNCQYSTNYSHLNQQDNFQIPQIIKQNDQIINSQQITQQGLVQINQSPNSIEQVKCSFHNEQYSLFCLSDKTLLCIECLYCTKIHKTHNIIPLKNAKQYLKRENEEFKIQSDNYLKKLEETLQIINQNQQTLNREFEKNSLKVNELFDNMVNTVNTKRQKIIDQLLSTHSIHSNAIQLQANELINIKNILEEYQHFDKQIIENEFSDSYIFSAFKMIQQALEQTNIEAKPIKINVNTVTIENSHKQLFQKLVDKIIQLQNLNVDSLISTKCLKSNSQIQEKQQSFQVNNSSNSLSKYQQNNSQKQNLSYLSYAPQPANSYQNLAYAPLAHHHSKEPTPKKSSCHSLSNTKNSNNTSNIVSSSKPNTQRGSQNKLQSATNFQDKLKKKINTFSEKVDKRLNTQDQSKNSYKTIKRRLSSDFNCMKENIESYPEQLDENILKKRSHSIQAEFLYNPIQQRKEQYPVLSDANVLQKRSNSIQADGLYNPIQINKQENSTNNTQQAYYLSGQGHHYIPQQITKENNNCQRIFLREKYTQNVQQNEFNESSIAKDNSTNTINLSLKRSPFKEYIIN